MCLGISCNNSTNNNQTVKSDTTNISAEEDDSAIPRLNVPTSKMALAIDPICKMNLDIHLSDTASFDGKLYGFCSEECKETFLKSPLTYLEEKSK